jgi:hypothetical protein
MTMQRRKARLRAIGAILALGLFAAAVGACTGSTSPTGSARAGGNPAGSWRWDTRGPPGYLSSGYRGADMS